MCCPRGSARRGQGLVRRRSNMKALVFSDIHSNYEALLAVAHAEKADTVWCLGD
jgi:hypothetical protein